MSKSKLDHEPLYQVQKSMKKGYKSRYHAAVDKIHETTKKVDDRIVELQAEQAQAETSDRTLAKAHAIAISELSLIRELLVKPGV